MKSININITLSDDKADELIGALKQFDGTIQTSTNDENETIPIEYITGEIYPGLTPAQITGKRLETLRTDAGFTQAELARQIGSTRQNISAMENARRPIGKTTALKFAEIFKVHYKTFL